MSVTDVAVRREQASESIVKLVAGLAVAFLTILGLAEVSLTFLVAIATIVFGVGILALSGFVSTKLVLIALLQLGCFPSLTTALIRGSFAPAFRVARRA
jgi:hypothetical protein